MAEKTAAYESELGHSQAGEGKGVEVKGEEERKEGGRGRDEFGSCEELEQIHADRLVS